MAATGSLQVLVVMILVLWCSPVPVACLPLSTSSRWIVDQSTGSRIKLACVNWVSHLSPMLAEGLHKQPLDSISSFIPTFGFNCVRLTWATHMFTSPSLSSQTVSQTFVSLNLSHALSGIALHNPGLLQLSVMEAFQAVVASLGRRGVMVVLDNQMSSPGWCCSDTDGNGFWGDKNFDPEVWLQGLRIVAAAFQGFPHVVGMSLRNELRGRRQNIGDWYKYMKLGAEAIHGENPDLLVIHSGLSYSQNLRFLGSRPLDESLTNKIVYELHWYSFTNGDDYTRGNLNDKCASVSAEMMNKAGFLTTPDMNFTGPLFISEFGVDQSGSRVNDNLFLPCFFAFAAAGDFDWAYWTLQGSYYSLHGKLDPDEGYGLMNHDWNAPRNRSFLRKLQALQQPFVQNVDISDSTSSHPYQVIFHPATGLCVERVAANKLILGSCRIGSHWRFNPSGQIALAGTYLIIAAEGEDQPAVLTLPGVSDFSETWRNSASATGMQFSTQVGNTTVCLDGSSPPSLFTRSCICTSQMQCHPGANPSRQWFKFVGSRPQNR